MKSTGNATRVIIKAHSISGFLCKETHDQTMESDAEYQDGRGTMVHRGTAGLVEMFLFPLYCGFFVFCSNTRISEAN